MYQFRKVTLAKGESYKYKILQQQDQLRYTDFITLLQEDEIFQSFLIDLFSNAPFDAFQWETPSVSTNTVSQAFEFVIHDSPGIDLPPDPDPFQQYFNSGSTGTVAVFDNLGGDAKLVAPKPLSKELNYSHIGVFTREAPKEQQHDLWKTVGQTVEKCISTEPLWLNTAGGGVAWLHVRLDSHPKYYQHQSYISGDRL